MLDWLWGDKHPEKPSLENRYDAHSNSFVQQRPADAVLASASEEGSVSSRHNKHIDDAPMTPVVYVVSSAHCPYRALVP